MDRILQIAKILSAKIEKRLEGKAISDIEHIRKALKTEPIVKKEFEEYGRDINEIDNVKIRFDVGLDVSAKTINGEIFLNADMLDQDWHEYFNYAVHEITHYLQHTTDSCNEEEDKNTPYLDNKSEIEAFQNQLKYKEKTESKKAIEKYLKQLLDKHDLKGKEREDKKKELLDE